MKSITRAVHAHACATLVRRADFEATDVLVRVLGSSAGPISAGPVDLIALLLLELAVSSWRRALARARGRHGPSAGAIANGRSGPPAPI